MPTEPSQADAPPSRPPDSPTGRPSGALPAISLLLLLVAAILGWWAWQGVPRALPELPDARLECVSYAPFRRPGETPFDPTAKVSEARLEEDLKLLAGQTACVRTYSVQQGLDAVPRVAARLGMKVLLGAWMGRNRTENEVELAKAIALAQQHKDVVRGLIVGNEVLLRRELPEKELAGYIDRARASAGVPVTYADVWEFWVQHPDLARSVDFMTIHILPYWEDEPVGIDGAIAHVAEIHKQMSDRFAGKPILIGETGWPSAGRARRDAVPGRIAQARFLRQFAQMARDRGISYNFIEAFDQPWKRRLEGAMGGHWGVLDSDGRAKFPVAGPVEEDPAWRDGFLAAAAGALAFGGAALLAVRRRLTLQSLLVHLLAGAGTGAVMLAQWRYLWIWNRDWIEWGTSGLFTVLALGFGWVGTRLLADRLDAGGPSWTAARWPSGWQAFQRLRGQDPAGQGFGLREAWALLALAMLFGAATMVVLLVFDARYRGFPWPLYAVPMAVAVLAVVTGQRGAADGREERLLAWIVWIGSVFVVVEERPSNLQAVSYLALVSLMAWAMTWRGRASDTAASSTPTVAGSKQ